jgi:hypothetical protein
LRPQPLTVVLTFTIGFLLVTNPVVVGAADLVTSSDIADNTIRSKDVRDGNLKGKDIKDGSLTGADVKESSLGTVPDASSLAGQPPAAYLDRVVRVSAHDSVQLSGGTFQEILGPVTIDVPAGAQFLRLDAVSTWIGTTHIVYFSVDGACSAGTSHYIDGQAGDATGTQDSTGLTFVVPVTPGTHTVRLCANSGPGTVNARSLVLQSVATGAASDVTAPPALP